MRSYSQKEFWRKVIASTSKPLVRVWSDVQLFVIIRAVKVKIVFEFGHGETVPPFGLLQKRPLLKRSKRRGLTIQRSCCAISAHFFQDDFPTDTNDFISLRDLRMMSRTIFQLVTGV